MYNVIDNDEYKSLVAATTEAERNDLTFDPKAFDLSATAIASASQALSTANEDFAEEESLLSSTAGLVASMKRGLELAPAARLTGDKKRHRGGQNNPYGMPTVV